MHQSKDLDDWLAVRRWKAMSPVPWVRHTDALDPVHLLTAGGAVEDQLPEFPLQVGLRAAAASRRP